MLNIFTFSFLLPAKFEEMRATKILESICAALRSMNYIAAINTIRNRIVKIYNLPTYWMKTHTEFNKASCSGKFKVISLATEFDLIYIYKMARNKIPKPTWLICKQFVKLNNQTNSLRDVNNWCASRFSYRANLFLIFIYKLLSKWSTNVWLYRLLFVEDTNIFSKDPLL